MNKPALDRSLINKHSFNRQELVDCGNGKLFGPGRAHLPVGEMLMIDRITEISEFGGAHKKGKVIAEMDVNPDLWFFACHFVGDPVMPGCLGLDALWQLVGFFLAWKGHWGVGRALGCRKVAFRGQILPSAKKLTYDIDMTRVRGGSTVIGFANAKVSVDGKDIYTADGVQVGLFTQLDEF